MLIDAAIRVVGLSADGSLSVNDVLAEASLSTRAFYRHFESKEALVDTLLLREAEGVGRALARAVEEAADPVAALDAWLDGLLDVFYEARRAKRARQLYAAATDRERGLSERVTFEMRRMSCAPLIRALEAGDAQGVLRSPTPAADAYSIYELALQHREALGRAAVREATRAHVERFAWPALGLAT
jgi:AcrR family transcriptional regulator